MAASSAEAIKEQVLEYLAPFREEEREEEGGGGAGGAPPPSTSGRRTVVVSIPRPRCAPPRLVELALDAHCDGVRVRDRLLWDLGDPAPLTAAWAAETARDLGLSADGCAALRAELEAAVAAARRESREGRKNEAIKRDDDDDDDQPGGASSWLPRVSEDRGGWGDA